MARPPATLTMLILLIAGTINYADAKGGVAGAVGAAGAAAAKRHREKGATHGVTCTAQRIYRNGEVVYNDTRCTRN